MIHPNSIYNRMPLRSRVAACRRGTATLEFVMGVPFLIAMGAAIIAVAYSGLNRTTTAVEARHATWKLRDLTLTPDSNFQRKSTKAMDLPFGEILSDMRAVLTGGDATGTYNDGQVAGDVEKQFVTFRWLGGSKKTKSRAAVLTDNWDYTNSQMATFSNRRDSLHVDVFKPVIGPMTVPMDVVAKLVTLDVKGLINIVKSPEEKAAEKKANDRKNEQDELMKQKIKEAHEEYLREQAELDRLKAKRFYGTDPVGLQKQYDDADEAYTTLRNQIPPASAEDISAAKNKRDAIEDLFPAADEDIRRQQIIRDAAYEKWKKWEAGANDATEGGGYGKDRDSNGNGIPDHEEEN